MDILTYFKNHTIHNSNKPTVTIYFPEYNSENKYIYRYISNILKQYLSKDIFYNIQTESNEFFQIAYESPTKNEEKLYFPPDNCEGFIKDIYSCLDILPKWVQDPYPLKSLVYDKVITKENMKQIIHNQPYTMVVNIEYPDYDHLIRTYHFIKKLKNEIGKILIYAPEENVKHYFKKGGFYVVDSNFSTVLYGGFYLEEFIKKAEKFFPLK